jgi:hypothetical protein
VIVGFQANHNAEADLLAIALMACGVIATALAGRVRNRTRSGRACRLPAQSWSC